MPEHPAWPPEIRRYPDGSVDEIVAYGPDGRCWFHLEQMDDSRWWMAIYPPSREQGIGLSWVIHSASGRAVVKLTLQDLPHV